MDQARNADPTAYRPPVTKPLELTEPQPIEWEIIDPDSIPPPTSATLDIDKLPAKPFSINEFKPLKTPMKEYALDWDNLPVTPLQFDTVDIKPKASIIQKPIITKIENPAIREGTTAGILQLAQTEGFPSSEIASIIENEDGTFWITFDDLGICLYNGEYLYTYKYEDIFNLVKDHEGRLWYTRNDGFYILDFKNNIQWHFPLSTGSRDLYCDHRGTIWISARDNVYTLKNDLKHLRKTSNKGFSRVAGFFEDRNHNFWIGDDRRILILDKERKGFKIIEENEQWHIGQPAAFHEDQKGYVWVSNTRYEQNGALSLSLEQNKARVLGLENGFAGRPILVQEDNKGRIWLMQNGSFSILSEDHSQIKTIPIKGDIFFSNNLWFDATIRDKRGNIWVSTRNSGVILIGRDGAIGEQLDESNGLLSGEVWGIDEDNRGEIWLATGAGGVNIYDPKKKVLRAIDRTILRNSPGRNISTIKEFDTDKYFVEGQIGFSIIDRLKNKIFHYDTDQFYGGFFEDILMDDSNNLWLPNSYGLMVYNTELNHAKFIRENTPQFPGTRTLNIIDDGAGHYWVATRGAGLMIINPKENTIQYLTEKEGLCNNHLVRILPRENGEMWIATIDGLSIINTENQTITNVKDEQGMIPDELYEIQEKEGVIYLGSVNGLIQMKPMPGKND
jgi:ligand-binding sensor domain-containing protein